ncbi:MAG TPA: DUF2127 domain-containing protein [Kofleriaceae bacterium]|jgi:uncharacterized membrane protein (DUF2068 family)|nr:DUF2127 domain-containing protein [Kofleriaceae bacterium]
MHAPRDVLIRLIAVFKLVKALLLIAIGVGALSLRHHHDGALGTWVHALVFDPHGRLFHEAIAKVSGLDTRQLADIAIGSLVYAAVFTVEGIGLMLRRGWAEVLTTLITVSFLPLEIYELMEHRSWAKIGVIVANALIVVYLVRRLRREGHWPFHRRRRLGELR